MGPTKRPARWPSGASGSRRRGSSPYASPSDRATSGSRPLEDTMGWSPAQVASAATLDTDAEARVASRVGGALEAVFEAVAATRADTTALLAKVAAQGRRPASADLAALRP